MFTVHSSSSRAVSTKVNASFYRPTDAAASPPRVYNNTVSTMIAMVVPSKSGISELSIYRLYHSSGTMKSERERRGSVAEM